MQPGAFPDAQKKMAFLQGSIEAAPGFPAQLLEALRGEPRPWAGFPLLLTSATPGEGVRHRPRMERTARLVYPGARVLESGNAVAVIPISKELVTGPRQAVGRIRQVEAALSQPLGNRVMLDGTGSPVMVTSL